MKRNSLAGLTAMALTLMVIGCGSNKFLTPPPLVTDPILIDARWVPSTPTAEQIVDIEVTVQNQGGFDAKAFKLRVMVVLNPCTPAAVVMGNYETEFEFGLQSGDADVGVVQHDFNNIGGTYGLYLFLDDDERLDECLPGNGDCTTYDGETNNVYTCGQVVNNQGQVTLSAGETFIVVLGQSGQNQPTAQGGNN